MPLLLLFDIPRAQPRRRFEMELRRLGFAHLFPGARLASAGKPRTHALARAARTALRGAAHRVVVLRVTGRAVAGASWWEGEEER